MTEPTALNEAASGPLRTLGAAELDALKSRIAQWGLELGFQQIGVADTDLKVAEVRLREWLQKGYHGTMNYMTQHGSRRSRPAELVPGTLRIIAARMDYRHDTHAAMDACLADSRRAYIARYALGADYHKLVRRRLQGLASRIAMAIGPFGYRVFADSAPVLEKPLAEKAGLGWIGKHTNLINREDGSWFFLGEIYTDLALPIDAPVQNHCGSCTACLAICPTQAIVAPYQLDARRCIAYLTIEHRGSIPVELRPMLGNRVFGCDDCQLVCPWNRFARTASEGAFRARHGLDTASLLELFQWTEAEFLSRTEGSPLRRTGYVGWLRNLAVGLGNAPFEPAVVQALSSRLEHPSEVVREHVQWALDRQAHALDRADG